MFAGALLWIAAATAMPLGGETVCKIEGCSFSDDGGNAHALIQRLVLERRDSDSGMSSPSGPALGVILGGVFGALGGLAILGILFYAWWSIRRMRSRYETEAGGGSSSGPSSSTSRGSSSKSKKKRPKDLPKWQDPWLSPAPRSSLWQHEPQPRTLSPIQFHASASIDVAKIPGPQDDQGSDSSAIPLKAIYPSDDKQ